MGKTIWKFLIPFPTQMYRLPMPAGAKIIHTDVQHGQICIWAEVDPHRPYGDRFFVIVGTGGYVEENLTHVGTVQIPPHVWHLYEVVR